MMSDSAVTLAAMSYDLAVFAVDGDGKAVRERIDAIFDSLEDGTEEEMDDPSYSDPRIAAFHAEITTIHPDDDEMNDDELGASPWSASPIAYGPDWIYLCMVYSRADEMHALVTRLAAKHGLTFYDIPEDEMHRPGWSLGRDARRIV